MPTLTYPGDVTNEIVGSVHGPTHLRELVTARTATYDEDANVTRVEFVYGVRCCECWGLLQADDPSEAVGDHDRFDLRLRHPGGECPTGRA